MGTGAATLIVGAVFAGLLPGMDDNFHTAGYEPMRVEYRDKMRHYAVTCDITFIGGGVLLAAGGALFIVDTVKHRSERATTPIAGRKENRRGDRKVSMTPLLSLGTGGVIGGLTGHF